MHTQVTRNIILIVFYADSNPPVAGGKETVNG